jgi:lysophospholipase L1-like esterase
MYSKLLSLFSFIFLGFVNVDTTAQKIIVVMGSSTAAGSDASSYNNAWVGRLQNHFRKSTTDGVDTVVQNIAQYGYATYHEMPSSFLPPLGRPVPDPNHNVTRALSFSPDVVIINLPSNDIAFGYTKKEMMDNLRLMYNNITASGVKCFIGTTQPGNHLTPAQRLAQRELVDSINLNFGYYSIDFWTDLVTNDGLYGLRDAVRAIPSDYHINDLGHLLLFQRVVGKSLFTGQAPLPLRLINFTASVKDNIVTVKWNIEEQEPDTKFELQRSKDSRSFESISVMNYRDPVSKAEYIKTDFYPLAGRSFYRLKITEPGKTFYSSIAAVEAKLKPLHIQRLYTDAGERLIADIYAASGKTVQLTIINASGAVLLQRKEILTLPYSKILVSLSGFNKGQYFIRIQTDEGQTAVKGFVW